MDDEPRWSYMSSECGVGGFEDSWASHDANIAKARSFGCDTKVLCSKWKDSLVPHLAVIRISLLLLAWRCPTSVSQSIAGPGRARSAEGHGDLLSLESASCRSASESETFVSAF